MARKLRERTLSRRKKQDQREQNLIRAMSDREVCDNLLPVYVLYLLIEGINKAGSTIGVHVRPDFLHQLDVLQQKILGSMMPEDAQAIAVKIDMDARSMSKDLHIDDVRHGLIAWCYTVLKLAEEGFIGGDNIAVLQATAMVAEATEVAPEVWSCPPHVISGLSSEMLKRVRRLGYYPKITIIH